MKIDVKVPEVGESVREALLAEWYRRDGDHVAKGDLLFLIETDKVTLEVFAEESGVLKILVPAGETVPIGKAVGSIDTEAAEAPSKEEKKAPAAADVPDRKESAPAPAPVHETPTEVKPAPAETVTGAPGLAPAVKRLVEERGADVSKISGTGPEGRITRGDVLSYLESEGERAPAAEVPAKEKPREEERAVPVGEGKPEEGGRESTRKPMSPIRRRIAERLLEARRNTAMLTTFNEIDMGRVQEIRGKFKEAFREKYGISLGIMSFFLKASVEALREFPEVNASIEGNDIVYHHFYDIGVAVGADRGLVVPVVRNADRLGFADIERTIADYVRKIRENRLELADLEGGTFTVTNGGVYGSLLSTPILNTPQSGILGLHRIEDRPVVLDGKIVARPMMYVALSYDHRIIDGREAVTFLRRIKDCVETPERIMMEI